MLAAYAFFSHGFEIEAKPEILKRGSDFDFSAIRGEVIVNVEVTALEEKPFHPNTAINALNHKRKQLPNDRPAVIFCVLPEKWESIEININVWAPKVAENFFKGTRRINAVVFLIERHIDLFSDPSKGGANMMVAKALVNPNPRFPCDLDDVLLAGGDSTPVHDAILNLKDNQSGLDALSDQFHQSEFFAWVDALAGQTNE